MATFTVELREVVDELRIDIGLKEYPIFDEAYREHLNKSIVDYFRYREIGFETVDLFINRLNARMRLIMPPYNELYKTTLFEIDPLTTTKLRTKSEGSDSENVQTNAETEAQSNSTSENDSTARSVNSTFPQNQLSGNKDYASNATDSVSKGAVDSAGQERSNSESQASGERTRETDTIMEGYTQSPADLILRYRSTLINVDMLIIEQLEPLFMQLWDTGDEYGDYSSFFYSYYYFGVF